MSSFALLVTFVVRLMLVLLFMPFSALDKVLNYRGAVKQAREAAPSNAAAVTLIVLGFLVEVLASIGILTGICDRAAAFVLAGYCCVTAIFWKQFWKPGDFWSPGESHARSLFWTFWKNFAVAGGLLLLAFGASASTVGVFLAHPFDSSRPYHIGD